VARAVKGHGHARPVLVCRVVWLLSQLHRLQCRKPRRGFRPLRPQQPRTMPSTNIQHGLRSLAAINPVQRASNFPIAAMHV
jgi:hypothetical protein